MFLSVLNQMRLYTEKTYSQEFAWKLNIGIKIHNWSTKLFLKHFQKSIAVALDGFLNSLDLQQRFFIKQGPEYDIDKRKGKFL